MERIDKLNDLIALDLDAVNAYESAIKRIKAVDVARQLRQFQLDHERHVTDLTACVLKLGGKARTKPDVKGFFIQGFTAVTSMMGDEAALRAMRGNEQVTTRTYARALESVWPDDVRALIERNLADERRHLAFIEEALGLRKAHDDA